MARWNDALNDAQIEILTWIGQGAPDGVYEGYAHRIVARTLHRRGLITITGRGPGWKARLTKDGANFLEHGSYSDQEAILALAAPTQDSQTLGRKESANELPVSAAKGRPRPSARVGPTDAMMNALTAAEGNQIQINRDEVERYRQLARIAKRFKKIPEGMQVTVHSDYRSDKFCVTLEPLPEWMTKVLAPISVPGTLRDLSDVVTSIKDREDLDIRAAERNRALRLLQALVTEARNRTYSITAVRAPRKDQWGYLERSDETTGHLEIKIGPDPHRLTIFQLKDRVEHVASKTELARAGRGYAVPKWDYLPTQRLGIRIEDKGYEFWGSAWTDTDEQPLDRALAQILQELELRHELAQNQRLEEKRRYLQRKAEWEVARERAIIKLTESHRAKILNKQIENWMNAARIRQYADAIESHFDANTPPEVLARVREWAGWARHYANKIDPLNGELKLPEPPEPSPTALEPFMKPLSPYGPSY